MSYRPPLEFTPPEGLNYPEFTSREEIDKILSLINSGVLRTHADTFNGLNAQYLNNLPGPIVTSIKEFASIHQEYLDIPDISNWQPSIVETFVNHLNHNKMYLLEEFLPKISTVNPKKKSLNYQKSLSCIFTKTFYIDSVRKVQIQNTIEIDSKTFLELATNRKYSDFQEALDHIKTKFGTPNFIDTIEINLENLQESRESLNELLKEIINIEKLVMAHQDNLFTCTQKEKEYIIEYSEPKLLEDSVELDIIDPGISSENLEKLIVLFKSLKIFWLFDTEILNKSSEEAIVQLHNDLTVIDEIELKPKIK